MERMHRLISIAAATSLLWPVYSAHAALINLDLSTWVVEQYELNVQADASWTVSGAENEIAFQSVNADASIFHGGFESVGTRIEGTFEVATANDDDLIGFVFGYQNRGQYYLFDWKQADQGAAGLGFAERGMTVKVVDTGGVDPTGPDLFNTAGSANVTPLYHNTIAWADNTLYGFSLNFTPGQFQIQVSEGNTVLDTITLTDSTFTNGEFGFYNYSQNSVRYSGFTLEPIPIPPAIYLFISGLLGLVGMTRRKVAVSF